MLARFYLVQLAHKPNQVVRFAQRSRWCPSVHCRPQVPWEELFPLLESLEWQGHFRLPLEISDLLEYSLHTLDVPHPLTADLLGLDGGPRGGHRHLALVQHCRHTVFDLARRAAEPRASGLSKLVYMRDLNTLQIMCDTGYLYASTVLWL